MPVTSTSGVVFSFEGDVVQPQQLLPAASNASSPGEELVLALSSGNNPVAIPAGATGMIVQKPAGNAVQLILKGVAGDTGVKLALTDPDRVSLVASSTVVINAAQAVTVRLIFT